MNREIPIIIAVEDDLSEAMIKILIKESCRPFLICACLGKKGISYLKYRINEFNRCARTNPFLVLVDLDNIACPPLLVKSWLNGPKQNNLIFRVAVREVEAWVMAHRAALANYFGIRERLIPSTPDDLSNPKMKLIELARRSPRRRLRESIVPAAGSYAKTGPDYNGTLINFVEKQWQLKEAMKNSMSLNKAFRAIQSFKPV